MRYSTNENKQVPKWYYVRLAENPTNIYICTFDAVIEAIVCNAFWPIFTTSLVR